MFLQLLTYATRSPDHAVPRSFSHTAPRSCGHAVMRSHSGHIFPLLCGWFAPPFFTLAVHPCFINTISVLAMIAFQSHLLYVPSCELRAIYVEKTKINIETQSSPSYIIYYDISEKNISLEDDIRTRLNI